MLTSTSRSFTHSNRLQARLHELVPGGAPYLRARIRSVSRRYAVLVRGQGARVWDVDGNEFIEYGMGLRSVVLGHGYRPVVESGMCRYHRWCQLHAPDPIGARSCREVSRTRPGRRDGEVCQERVGRHDCRHSAGTGSNWSRHDRHHPFFSVDDWFIVTTEMSSGIPSAALPQALRFEYNDLASLDSLFAAHPASIAAVILEPATATAEPAPGFLDGVRALCDAHGAVMIFDEIITGFRWSMHGAQSIYGVTPDLSCWGKAIGNGFPISALAGRRELMQLGGLNTDRDRVFLLSTTYGAETSGLAAFRAVAEVYRREDPIGKMEWSGRQLAAGVNQVASDLGIEDFFQVLGRPSCLVFATRDADQKPSQAFRTLFLQEMLRRGILGQSFVVSAAHTAADIEETIDGVQQALVVYSRAIEAGTVEGLLTGESVAPAIRRFAYPRRIDA